MILPLRGCTGFAHAAPMREMKHQQDKENPGATQGRLTLRRAAGSWLQQGNPNRDRHR
jgi:hypothetical protein